MKTGTLYNERNVGGTNNVDVQIEDSEFEKLISSDVGTSISVKVSAMKGHTGNDPQIFIKKEYDQFFVEGVTLENVEVTSINGSSQQVVPQGNLFPHGVELEVKGDRNQV